MRKYFFVYAEIYFLAEENFSPCGRRKIFFRKEIWRLAHGREFPFGRKRISLGKEGGHSGQKEATEGEGLVPWRDTERG